MTVERQKIAHQPPLVLRHFGRQARSYPKSFAAALVLGSLLLWLGARRCGGRRFGS